MTNVEEIDQPKFTQSFKWGNRIADVPDLTESLYVYNPENESLPITREDIIIYSFTKGRTGGFGAVLKGLLAESSQSCLTVAVKFPLVGKDSDGLKYKNRKRFRSEAVVWNLLDHANILPFLGIAELPGLPISFVSLYVPNGDVRRFLTENPSVARLPIIQGVAEGLAYLHSQNVIHGDLKGGNVLVAADGNALLCDFGLATLIAQSDDEEFEKSETILQSGSRYWMAPELILAEQPGTKLSKKTDIWSFAMVAIEVFTNSRPWGNRRNFFVIMDDIQAGERPGRPESLECNDTTWSLISGCWDINPEHRPDAEEVRLLLRS